MTALATLVFVSGANKPFGDLKLADVRGRAAELEAAVGFGPTAKVAPVARAWAALADQMEQAQAPSVAALEAPDVEALAQRLWVIPPGGSLL